MNLFDNLQHKFENTVVTGISILVAGNFFEDIWLTLTLSVCFIPIKLLKACALNIDCDSLYNKIDGEINKLKNDLMTFHFVDIQGPF